MQPMYNKQALLLEGFPSTSGVSYHAYRAHLIVLPPVDYRYGWDLHQEDHQQQFLELYHAFRKKFTMLELYCRPWSQSNKNTEPTELEHRRNLGRPLLSWTAKVVAPEVERTGGQLVLENPSKSAIWSQSDLVHLPELFTSELHDNLTDQCAHGAWSVDLELPIRKRTIFKST
eukprot:7518188-Pyramimonas_sp.AAC.1